MSLYNSLDRTKHFAEFGEPLDSQEGMLSPTARKARALANLGLTATAAEINAIADLPTGYVVGIVPTATRQAINANGAINVTSYYTAITSVATTGQTFTFGSGVAVGQLKKIQLIVDDGDATVTFNSTATIVFADVGDFAVLLWTGTAWVPIELGNDADGVTGPAYTPAS